MGLKFHDIGSALDTESSGGLAREAKIGKDPKAEEKDANQPDVTPNLRAIYAVVDKLAESPLGLTRKRIKNSTLSLPAWTKSISLV
jgi:hypothetical protein